MQGFPLPNGPHWTSEILGEDRSTFMVIQRRDKL